MNAARDLPLAAAIALTLLARGVPAQSPAEQVALPQFQVGDSWTYNKLEGAKREYKFAVASEIVAVTADTIVLQAAGIDGSGATRVTRNRQFNLMRMESGSHRQAVLPFYPSYAFPLYPGKTWTQDVEFQSSADGARETRARLRARVAGWDLVTVPAGTFRALLIEIDGSYWAQNLDGTWVGEIQDRLWFAPEARNAVRYEYRDTVRGAPYTQERFELLRYRLAR